MFDLTSIDWHRRYGGRTSLGRLMSKVDYRSQHGCWVWIGAISDTGYGSVAIQRQKVNAHRLVFQLWYGPVPAGLELDHLCRVRSCVNPEHLEPVNRWENHIRSESPASKNARATHCRRGHAYSEENSYHRPDGKGINCLACVRLRSLRRTDRKHGWSTAKP